MTGETPRWRAFIEEGPDSLDAGTFSSPTGARYALGGEVDPGQHLTLRESLSGSYTGQWERWVRTWGGWEELR